MKKKVGLYAGHGFSTDGKWDPGTTYNGKTEAVYMLAITKSAVKHLRTSGVTMYTDANAGNNINMIKQVEMSNAKGVDIHVALHCDYAGAPTGTLPLYVSQEGYKLANAINKSVMPAMKIGTRGLTKRADLYELNNTKAVACIFECGSIDDDWKILGHSEEYGKAIAKGICSYLGVKFKESKPLNIKTKKPYPIKIVLPARPLSPWFRKGDKGKKVLVLQKALVWAGYKLPMYGEDSDYGTETETAVNAFEKDHGLKQDKRFGKKCNSIFKTLKR